MGKWSSLYMGFGADFPACRPEADILDGYRGGGMVGLLVWNWLYRARWVCMLAYEIHLCY